VQTSLAVQHRMSAAIISCVCLHGNYCSVMPVVHTWRGVVVSESVCHDCRSLLAAPVSWSHSTAVLISIISASLLTASSVLDGMYPTCDKSCASDFLQNR